MPDDIPRPTGRDCDGFRFGLAGDECRRAALHEFGVVFEADVVSAHRMPDAMINYGRTAHSRGSR